MEPPLLELILALKYFDNSISNNSGKSDFLTVRCIFKIEYATVINKSFIMKRIILLLVIFTKLTVFSQAKIYVVDSISQQALSYARINFGEYGIYTNEKGYFILKRNESKNDFSISHRQCYFFR